MTDDRVTTRLNEAVELVIVSDDMTIDEGIVALEQATQRLERARDSRGGEA